jgi:steroid delta-isomerase
MATPQELKDAVDRHLSAARRNDPAGMLAVFADDAELEDPIGTEPRRGREALEAFFAVPRDVTMLRRIGPLTAFGNHVGVQFRVRLGPDRQVGVSDGKPFELSTTEIFTFDDEGKVVRMVAVPDIGSGSESTEGRTFDA